MQAKQFLYISLLLLFASCSTLRNRPAAQRSAIRFLDEYVIPNKTTFQGTKVGGLSGIDYDQQQGVYYVISDDRSNINPARFYTFSFDVTQSKIANFKILGVDSLRMKNGDLYPNAGIKAMNVPDPESIRYNPHERSIVWSSEGERIVDPAGNSILYNPSVTIADKSGKEIETLPVPKQFIMSEKETGPRRNGVFEGLSFADNFKTLFVSTEEPLYNDGPRATPTNGGWCRIVQYDYAQRKPIAQYAYPLDKVAKKPIPRSAFSVNGISEILAISPTKLIVIERSFSMGYLNNTIKLYLAELSDAANSQDIDYLKEQGKNPIKKKLLLNLNVIGKRIDNIEGITLGPALPNGRRSLILVSDNNFLGLQKTQLLLFEIDLDQLMQ